MLPAATIHLAAIFSIIFSFYIDFVQNKKSVHQNGGNPLF